MHYNLLDGGVVIEADNGSRTVPLSKGSVSMFYASFCDAADELGIHRPRSSLICEIPDAPPCFEDDHVERTWDGHAARLTWTALNLASDGLEAAQPTVPPPHQPPFMQNAQLDTYVSVGFSFGDAKAPNVGMYAYIWPQPDGLGDRSWGVEGAAWHPDAGLVRLPWAKLRETADPHQAIVAFGDAVYDAAVETAGWPSDLVGPRVEGWYMSKTPPALVQHQHG